MKKKIFSVFAIILCCFVLTACGGDAVCGDWKVDSYSYLYNGVTYEYTNNQAKDFEPNIEIMQNKDGKYTDEQVVQASIGFLYTQSHNLIYRFNAKNVLEIIGVSTSIEYNWSRKGNSIVATLSNEVENILTFVIKDDNTMCITQQDDTNELNIILKRS